MTIYNAAQLREWDAYTIEHEPVSSIDLMERAAGAVCGWVLKNRLVNEGITIFCGPGNNGADGLAIARLLHLQGRKVTVFLLQADEYSPDSITNQERLKPLEVELTLIQMGEPFPVIPPTQLVIEALYGTGISRPLTGLAADLVQYLNQQEEAFVLSVDMPAGLPADMPLVGVAVKADITLGFQCPKLAFFMAENEPWCGNWQILDIGLAPDFTPMGKPLGEWVLQDSPLVKLKKIRRHAFKSLLGHALISAGSTNKLGAAIMSAAACLRSGSGLLTVALPEDSFGTIQNALPEAMCILQEDAADDFFLSSAKISAAGIGPGWSTGEAHAALLEDMLIKTTVPLLLDATALFHLSGQLHLLNLRPEGAETIITPHAGEFVRLFGPSANSFERRRLAIAKAKEHRLWIVMKGAFTQVITPQGQCYINSTGNPGMAKGGSGDVLTGIITSLLAQRYAPLQACVLGVYAHGLAGDLAAKKYGPQGMKAMDIVNELPAAWQVLAGQD